MGVASAPPDAKADVGSVLGRGFGTLGANFLPFLAISLVLVGGPAFATQYWVSSSIELADPGFSRVWGSLLISLVTSALLQGMLVRSTILHLSGRDPAPGASALLALRLLPALIGLSLLLALVVGIGLVLLIVPGVMIYCATAVAVPALIEERCGLYESVERSRALTRGTRWQVFGLVAICWIVAAVIQGMVGLFRTALSGLAEPVMPDPAIAGIAEGVSASLSTMIIAVVTAALYVELREVREGATVNELADVFA
ncbi:MAG TPA: hypothetical protein VK614_12160 [Allosphingosinicella sp.]|nr:hypothetical protein [Allosphingosinicella sp.]